MKAPDELLAEIRREVEGLRASSDDPSIDPGDDAALLLRHIQDLDAHLSRGGELPKAWAPPGLIRVQEQDLAELIARAKWLPGGWWQPGGATPKDSLTCIVCGKKEPALVLRRGNVEAATFLSARWGTVTDAGNVITYVCSQTCGELFLAPAT